MHEDDVVKFSLRVSTCITFCLLQNTKDNILMNGLNRQILWQTYRLLPVGSQTEVVNKPGHHLSWCLPCSPLSSNRRSMKNEKRKRDTNKNSIESGQAALLHYSLSLSRPAVVQMCYVLHKHASPWAKKTNGLSDPYLPPIVHALSHALCKMCIWPEDQTQFIFCTAYLPTIRQNKFLHWE